MSVRFEGKVAMITGAAHGLGASHALSFAREGADVALLDICQDLPEVGYGMGTEKEMMAVVTEIQNLGHRAIGIKCDVRQANEVESAVRRVINEFGKIDILVNNAGIALLAKPIWEFTEEAWDLIVNIMLKGTFLCCKYVLPHMIKQKYGKVINTSSIAARGMWHNVPYSATKAAINTLTLAMAKDVGEYNINVNCVAPGPVLTPMQVGAIKSVAPDYKIPEDKFYGIILQKFSILGKEITQQEVSSAVLFLCSEEARNVNGTVLYVDGGFLSV
jgi:NAD(P)-dependent dehydrogenase (short-subunit alcohol dehydrogenase family)